MSANCTEESYIDLTSHDHECNSTHHSVYAQNTNLTFLKLNGTGQYFVRGHCLVLYTHLEHIYPMNKTHLSRKNYRNARMIMVCCTVGRPKYIHGILN